MSDVAIRVDGLSKRYRLGVGHSHDTLRDVIAARTQAWLGRSRPDPQQRPSARKEFWALRDVAFEVKQGEVLGVIGGNGAGKSTLLKVLSRITEPTSGRIQIFGRVGSLLEVGTGFDRELTGRENIYMNGAVLGMRKAAIDRAFDAIVDFAGVEAFIDTPVKRYSSGMYVRLAFAVAAHLQPEILIVDEVLAVGDSQFQRKCLGKMGDVAKAGRTVLFVSHNMGAVTNLCSRAIHLVRGQVAFDGNTPEAVAHYLSMGQASDADAFRTCPRSGTGKIRVTSLHMESVDGKRLSLALSGQTVGFVVGFQRIDPRVRRVSVGISFHADDETGLFQHYSHFSGEYFESLPETGHFRFVLPKVPLVPGNYLIGVRITADGEEVDWPKVLSPVTVGAGTFHDMLGGDGTAGSWGRLLVHGTWTCEAVGEEAGVAK